MQGRERAACGRAVRGGCTAQGAAGHVMSWVPWPGLFLGCPGGHLAPAGLVSCAACPVWAGRHSSSLHTCHVMSCHVNEDTPAPLACFPLRSTAATWAGCTLPATSARRGVEQSPCLAPPLCPPFLCSTAATWANRAACYLKLGRSEEALADARVARALDPKYIKVGSPGKRVETM